MTPAVAEQSNRFDSLASRFDLGAYKELNEEISFKEYLDRVYTDPRIARSAYQRIYDMIVSCGVEKFKRYNKTVTRYKFFDDAEIPIFGLEEPLEQLVKAFRSAAGWYGVEKRILLLHGPVGSSKSTICRLLKRGLERESRKPDCAIYTFKWVNIPTELDTCAEINCPMHEDPLMLIPDYMRAEIERDLNDIFAEQCKEAKVDKPYPIRIRGNLDPHCGFYMDWFLKLYEGDWQKIITNHIVVRRVCFSEKNRIGIGTFQPKDEKNQDATELTGDINFRKLGEIGKDSDPRAFSFDGELNIANRGICEFIEMLKLDKAFLYDLLGAAQERQIKPKKFSQVGIDLAIISHTNDPEFQKLKADKTMEALKDRTIRIDIPYLLEVSKELKILEHDYGKGKVPQHIAPHTLECVALWLVLTRLNSPKSGSIVDKAKLYDGKILPGWTEDRVKEMHDPDEGLTKGVSCRYAQNKISDCLVGNHKYINPFMVLSALKEGLEDYTLIDSKDDIKRYLACIDSTRTELNEILKKEVQGALITDDNAIGRLCANYIDNVFAHIEGTKIRNAYTNEEEDPDENLMRSIEEKIDIPDSQCDDFRRAIAGFIGGMHKSGKSFKWDSEPRLKKAFEAKMFEDTKDHIKISKLNVGAQVVEPDIAEKIDNVKKNMIRLYGYNEESATDVLNYIGSLFARGDLVE